MSWRTVKLGELVENFSVRAKDVGGAEGLDFYGVSNEDGIIKTKYAAEDKAEDYKIIEKGCFAYNPYRVNVGSLGLVSDDTRGLISPAYVIFKPKPKSIIPELLFKFLKSAEGLRQIIFYARGTVRQALRFEDLCNIEISIPDYSEQQGLYNKLINSQKSSNILDAELKNQLILVKKLRQQLLQDAVQGKLVEQNPDDEPASELLKKIKAEKAKLINEKKLKKEKELPPIKPEEIPFEIPENWFWCRLGEICDFISGYNFESSDFGKGIGAKCIKITNAGVGEVIETDDVLPIEFIEKFKSYLVFEGDLILALTRPYILDGLKISKCPTSYNSSLLNQRVALIRANYIDPDYVYQFLRSDYVLKKYKSMFEGKGQQPNLKKEDVVELLIPLPPLIEQSRIVQKLDELMHYCNELEVSIKQSESQNEKLLQQVLKEALRFTNN